MKPAGISDRSALAKLTMFSIQYCNSGLNTTYLKPVADSGTYLTKKKVENFCRIRK